MTFAASADPRLDRSPAWDVRGISFRAASTEPDGLGESNGVHTCIGALRPGEWS